MKSLMFALVLACTSPAWAVTEWVNGEVRRLDPERSRIVLKHARIDIVKMAPMTMPFKVSEAALLAPLKVGDKVRFEVLLRDSELIVQRIEVRR
jgi:Cu/Ag efflux protein CusF